MIGQLINGFEYMGNDSFDLRNNLKVRFAHFKCSCGKIVNLNMSRVNRGLIQSCGCKRRLPSDIGEKIGNCIYNGKDIFLEQKSGFVVRKAEFICECGNIFFATVSKVKIGHIKSCGCMLPRVARERSTTHGMSETSEYSSWSNMKTRCYYEAHESYSDYGGRGIKVCDRWLHSFENFFSDMGKKPSPEHGIDRYPDVNGNYEPSNCRWATSKQQTEAKRVQKNLRIVVFNGEDIGLKELCKTVGIEYTKVRHRLKCGLDIEAALYLGNYKRYSKKTG